MFLQIGAQVAGHLAGAVGIEVHAAVVEVFGNIDAQIRVVLEIQEFDPAAVRHFPDRVVPVLGPCGGIGNGRNNGGDLGQEQGRSVLLAELLDLHQILHVVFHDLGGVDVLFRLVGLTDAVLVNIYVPDAVDRHKFRGQGVDAEQGRGASHQDGSQMVAGGIVVLIGKVVPEVRLPDLVPAGMILEEGDKAADKTLRSVLAAEDGPGIVAQVGHFRVGPGHLHLCLVHWQGVQDIAHGNVKVPAGDAGEEKGADVHDDDFGILGAEGFLCKKIRSLQGLDGCAQVVGNDLVFLIDLQGRYASHHVAGP